MPKYKIDVAMDIRAYGFIEVEADDIDKAVELATPDFIVENFNSHGYNDFDYSSPRDIWLSEFRCEDTDEVGFVEKDLPNSHYPGGLVQDAAPDMLAALKALLQIIEGAREDDEFDANTCDAGGIIFGDIASEAVEASRAAIAKAEGKP